MIALAIGLAVSDATLWGEIQPTLLDLPVRIAFEQAGITDLPSFLAKVERMRPDAVLVDLAGLPMELAEFVEIMKSAPGAPFVVVANGDSNPELILNALRAGAREFLFPPLKPALQGALLRLSAERERRTANPQTGGRLVGFLSAKGGCGSTTLACHAAVMLERATQKATLLCDFDLGSGLVRFLMHSRSRYSVLDAFTNAQRLDHSYWRAILSNGSGNLDVLSAPEAPPWKDAPTPQQVHQVLRFARTEYDWVIADLGRGLSALAHAAIEELDDIFLVTTPDVPALHLAKQTVQQVLSRGFTRNRLHLVLNRVTHKLDVAPKELEEMIGMPFYSTLRDHERELHEAYSEARLLSSDSPLLAEMDGMISKLAGLPPKTRKRFTLFG